jgi:hypothetical protein
LSTGALLAAVSLNQEAGKPFSCLVDVSYNEENR